MQHQRWLCLLPPFPQCTLEWESFRHLERRRKGLWPRSTTSRNPNIIYSGLRRFLIHTAPGGALEASLISEEVHPTLVSLDDSGFIITSISASSQPSTASLCFRPELRRRRRNTKTLTKISRNMTIATAEAA